MLDIPAETEILDKRPESTRRKGRYPWMSWFDGRWRVLVQGTHFHGSPSSIRSSIYQANKRLREGEKVRVITFTDEQIMSRYNDGLKRVCIQASINGEFPDDLPKDRYGEPF